MHARWIRTKQTVDRLERFVAWPMGATTLVADGKSAFAALPLRRDNLRAFVCSRGWQKISASPTEPANRSSREARAKVGSSGWARTSNPPVNRLMQVVYLVGSSWV